MHSVQHTAVNSRYSLSIFKVLEMFSFGSQMHVTSNKHNEQAERK